MSNITQLTTNSMTECQVKLNSDQLVSSMKAEKAFSLRISISQFRQGKKQQQSGSQVQERRPSLTCCLRYIKPMKVKFLLMELIQVYCQNMSCLAKYQQYLNNLLSSIDLCLKIYNTTVVLVFRKWCKPLERPMLMILLFRAISEMKRYKMSMRKMNRVNWSHNLESNQQIFQEQQGRRDHTSLEVRNKEWLYHGP